jgi:hypothetical protein
MCRIVRSDGLPETRYRGAPALWWTGLDNSTQVILTPAVA